MERRHKGAKTQPIQGLDRPAARLAPCAATGGALGGTVGRQRTIPAERLHSCHAGGASTKTNEEKRLETRRHRQINASIGVRLGNTRLILR